MKKLILAVGRQCASGGHEIGEKIAPRLGIAFYDKKGLMEIARGEVYDEVRAFYEEQPVNSLLYALAMGMDQEQLGQAPFSQIRRLADQGSCVIIGRCSGYIFRRDPEAVTLFVHADRDMRIERVMKYEGISRREAEKLVDKTDEDRAAFYQYYTRRQWGMAENYELCLDSGKLGIDGTVDAVLDYLERRKFL